ncbi:hypothetical protein, partial [Mesorhizobium sp. M1C.F.Ca.ET.204.01.1.1]|uniref:hypothetical protein n=1 Tax=Mesorhizobium sp. M1C.F.Ca.ET.204.01.1.1 TaxID=2563929 RepID=UPI001AEE17E6
FRCLERFADQDTPAIAPSGQDLPAATISQSALAPAIPRCGDAYAKSGPDHAIAGHLIFNRFDFSPLNAPLNRRIYSSTRTPSVPGTDS